MKARLKLAIADIAREGGTCTVTLRSGTQLIGFLSFRDKQDDVVLMLHTDRGWHVIAWDEIAALTGDPSPGRAVDEPGGQSWQDIMSR